MKRVIFFFSMTILAACSGGYSFTGADVGDAKTVSVEFFPNYAELINPQLSQVFTETLRDIFVQQTPLNLTRAEADLQYSGSIEGYEITYQNAQAGAIGTVAQNRLTIVAKVNFVNTLDETKSFEQQFSRFRDFDANADLAQVEGELVEQITRELAENILNQSVGSW